MAIRVPGARLLRDVPFSFFRSSGRGKREVDAHIALVPFIDFLLTVTVFLLMSFSASGSLPQRAVTLPDAANAAEDLESAPIVTIDEDHVTLDGRRVADVRALAGDARLERIEPMVGDLQTARRNCELLHPNDPCTGHVIVQADRETDYRIIRKVMFSVAQAGYIGTQLAVRPR